METNRESRRHHFVPEFLLRPWSHRGEITGYFWDRYKKRIASKRRGTKSFCFQTKLLTLQSHPAGSDVLEKNFFGEIDTKGAIARDILVCLGPVGLSEAQRCDFARLLMSLEARRPQAVDRIRDGGREFIREQLNSDEEVLSGLAELGLKESPSEFFERQTGQTLTDNALLSIQKIVDNPDIGKQVINLNWCVRNLVESDQSLVLSDRPLLRLNGINHVNGAWIIPLSPNVLFFASKNLSHIENMKSFSDRMIARETNKLSARQAERFVFSVQTSDEQWLPKFLRTEEPIHE